MAGIKNNLVAFSKIRRNRYDTNFAVDDSGSAYIATQILSPKQEVSMTKIFLSFLLLFSFFSAGTFGQIPAVIESAENLERGREIIEKAREKVFGEEKAREYRKNRV